MKTIVISLYLFALFPSSYVHAGAGSLAAKVAAAKAAAREAADDVSTAVRKEAVEEMLGSIKEIMDKKGIPISSHSQLDEGLKSFSNNKDEEALMKIFYRVNGQKLDEIKEVYGSLDTGITHNDLKETVLKSLRSIFDPRFPSSERLNAITYVYSEFSPMLARLEPYGNGYPYSESWFFNKTMIWALNNCVGDALKSYKKEDVLKEIQKIVSAKTQMNIDNNYTSSLGGRNYNDEYLVRKEMFSAASNLLYNVNKEAKEAFDLIIELVAQTGSKMTFVPDYVFGESAISRMADPFMFAKQQYRRVHGVSMESDPNFVFSSDNILYAIIPNLTERLSPIYKFDLSVRTFLFKKRANMWNSGLELENIEDVHFLIKAMLFESKNKSSIDSIHKMFEEVREALVESIKSEDEEIFNRNLTKILDNNPEFAKWVDKMIDIHVPVHIPSL